MEIEKLKRRQKMLPFQRLGMGTKNLKIERPKKAKSRSC